MSLYVQPVLYLYVELKYNQIGYIVGILVLLLVFVSLRIYSVFIVYPHVICHFQFILYNKNVLKTCSFHLTYKVTIIGNTKQYFFVFLFFYMVSVPFFINRIGVL